MSAPKNIVMLTLAFFVGLSLLSLISCSTRSHDDRNRALCDELNFAPLWYNIEDGAAGDAQLSKLTATYHKLSEASTDSLRSAIADWLKEKANDISELDNRLDNAKILSVFIFEVPKNHYYVSYFSGDPNNLIIARPGFLEAVNRGRFVDKQSIDDYLKEFDKLARECKRRNP